MKSLSFFKIYFYDKGNNFNGLVALSKNFNMLDFARNSYVVNKSKYPRKV